MAEAIHERTGGNPLFTEEVVQSLIESGSLEGTRGSYRLVTPIARLQVPPTVHALLAARIDRLGEREKHVLQAAAVIGNDFPEPILAGPPASFRSMGCARRCASSRTPSSSTSSRCIR